MAGNHLNLRHLRAFCEVARCGSISAAGETVFLSQPAISQALAKLERTLGAALLMRTASGVFLTEPGEVFVRRARRALTCIETGARRVARQRRSGPAGPKQFDRVLTGGQLRALIAVSETGNFSWAARRTGVSQPSLHRMARDLERVSGVRLFNKSAQGIELTPAARVLERSARLAFSELDQGVAEVSAWLGREVTHVHIGTLPLVRSHVLPNAINDFTKMRPEARVSVVDGPYEDLLHGLRHGRLDFLIGALRDPVPVDDVVQETLFADELAIVAGSAHPLVGKSNISTCDLVRYPWVAPAPGIPTRDRFDRLFDKAGFDPPSGLVESSSLILIRGLLAGSDRLTLISRHQVRHEVEQGLLRILDFDFDDTPRPIGLTMRQDWQPTAAQSLLLDLLRRTGMG